MPYAKILPVCKKCGRRPTKVKVVGEEKYQVVCVCGHKGREPKDSIGSAIGCWVGQQAADIKRFGNPPERT